MPYVIFLRNILPVAIFSLFFHEVPVSCSALFSPLNQAICTAFLFYMTIHTYQNRFFEISFAHVLTTSVV
jgi:hypothetical protein